MTQKKEKYKTTNINRRKDTTKRKEERSKNVNIPKGKKDELYVSLGEVHLSIGAERK